jgi:hypothetical protein
MSEEVAIKEQASSQKKKAMIEALEKSLGVVTTAAKQIGIHRSTHHLWMQSDPEYAQAVHDLKEVALDFAESHLHQKIKAGDTASIIFFLKTQGKKRGYVERQEITGEEGVPIIQIAGNL